MQTDEVLELHRRRKKGDSDDRNGGAGAHKKKGSSSDDEWEEVGEAEGDFVNDDYDVDDDGSMKKRRKKKEAEEDIPKAFKKFFPKKPKNIKQLTVKVFQQTVHQLYLHKRMVDLEDAKVGQGLGFRVRLSFYSTNTGSEGRFQAPVSE